LGVCAVYQIDAGAEIAVKLAIVAIVVKVKRTEIHVRCSGC
jgi:hypothetical protein